MFCLICLLSHQSFFRFNLVNLLIYLDKSISFTLLFEHDLSYHAGLIMLAILFTVASISAGVTASLSILSISFLSII